MAVVNAKVAATTPKLTVYFDGDHTHAVPVQALAGYTPTIGDRVAVQIRPRGLLPVVQGKVAAT